MRGPAGDLFDGLARRYDRANRVISLGQDLRWKRRAVSLLQPIGGRRCLDVGAGTGDLARELHRRGAEALAIDASAPMLRAGRLDGIAAVVGDAQRLPVADGTADGIVTGFLLRNLPDLPAFLAEAARALKPGGLLVVLEIAYPRGRLRRALFKAWFHGAVPLLGGLATGRFRDYAYLSRSLRAFPPPAELARMAERAGFARAGLEHGSWTGMFLLTLRKE